MSVKTKIRKGPLRNGEASFRVLIYNKITTAHDTAQFEQINTFRARCAGGGLEGGGGRRGLLASEPVPEIMACVCMCVCVCGGGGGGGGGRMRR
jgi:hypothetical protein